MIKAPYFKTNTRFFLKSYLLLQKLYCHFDLRPKMKKFILNLIFSKIVFLHYLRRPLFFWKKIADINSLGYYTSDNTKTKNSPLHHHINVFSDNSVHWCGLVGRFVRRSPPFSQSLRAELALPGNCRQIGFTPSLHLLGLVGGVWGVRWPPRWLGRLVRGGIASPGP